MKYFESQAASALWSAKQQLIESGGWHDARAEPGSWWCKICWSINGPSVFKCTGQHKGRGCFGTQGSAWGGYANPPNNPLRLDPDGIAERDARKAAKLARYAAAQEGCRQWLAVPSLART